jgi:4-aminobutyrate aminotransferase-like enzyme/Ser/Thr protein kinase RdoA (MazF antagonist)
VRIARETFGVDAAFLEELPSERDQNVHLREAGGRELVLKIASASESRSILELQNEALAHVERRDPELPLPRLRRTVEGEPIGDVEDEGGARFFCRLFDYLEGKPLARFRPHSDEILRRVGTFLGRLDRALEGFSHESQDRYLKWSVKNARAVLEDGLSLVEPGVRRELLSHFLRSFDERIAERLSSLPQSVIHNDANDHNVLIGGASLVSGILDFGDMVSAPTVCEVANAAAYAMLEKPDPLRAARAVVAGYHEARPLGEEELDLLLALVGTRLAMSVSISARQFRDEPDKEYLRVSEDGAWKLLLWMRQHPEELGHYHLRAACGLPPCPRSSSIATYLAAAQGAPVLAFDLAKEKPHVLDLSVGSKEIGGLEALEDVERFTGRIFDAMRRAGARVGIGRYDEPRPIYTSPAFQRNGGEPRTVHLGIDLFVEAGTPVHAPLDGRIASFRNNDAPLDYGPTVVLQHETDSGEPFYTLYGHLSLDSLDGLERGRGVRRGEAFARVGSYPSNGNWPPHLHFQVVADLLEKDGDFPGVAAPSEREIWLSLSPDPAPLLGLPETSRAPRLDAGSIEERRREHLSGALSLAYRKHLPIVRGSGAFLYDTEGRPYLDMVNNVCHVGHCHPKVVRALSGQASVLNTNTRYLHPNIVEYARRLASLLPEPLEVLFFVNSGSEANDLALRLARTHTRRKETFVLDGAYHGNLTSLIEVSPYKFDGPGGEGAPSHVQKLDMPDGYRGRYRRSRGDYAERYVADVRDAVKSGDPGAFLAEAILSCGGQIVLPPGYLKGVYEFVRGAGGVVIADEVQVGFGRVGSHFWGFEAEGVVPDIVTMGKPIGNGHPLGAVATTRAIARSFETGMEYFNTFGGNPVSCAVGLAVLDAIEEEGLQRNAREMGDLLLGGLRSLAKDHRILGDVRGRGLFLGFEMVRDRETLAPAAEEAAALVNRMKEEGILLSTDGPLENVIKIKPPLVFSKSNAELFLDRLGSVLEDEAFRV